VGGATDQKGSRTADSCEKEGNQVHPTYMHGDVILVVVKHPKPRQQGVNVVAEGKYVDLLIKVPHGEFFWCSVLLFARPVGGGRQAGR
jgi:hypothetical protein